jgi:two-component system, OmpR family, osmolarity sensor histidine kinase EnvZ
LQLTTAADALGRGAPPPPLAANAPQEIQQVADEIHNMAANLARLTEEKTLMLAGVSHDLRTPLAKMRLSIAMLPATADPSLVSNLEKSTLQMEAIIDQFIDYARTGQDEAPTMCDVQAVIHDALSLVSQDAPHERTDITLEIESPSLRCRMRPLAIARALMNLINNARQYGRHDAEDAARITLRTYVRENALHLEVSDDGPGLTDDEMMTMQKPFARRDHARRELRAGLGLAIVARAAQLHGGELTLASSVNAHGARSGLTATIKLPLVLT